MSGFLTVFHVVFCLVGIASGAMVLFGLCNGKVLDQCTVLFLRVSLIASIAGLLSQMHDMLPAQKVSMLSVYVSGVAILAWRKFELTGIWSSIFAFTATIVLCLDVMMILIQAFKWFAPVNASGSPQSNPALLATQLLITVLFAALGLWAAWKFNEASSHRS